MAQREEQAALSIDLSELLVGPDDGEPLTPVSAAGALIGHISGSRLFHPVIDGIPVILPRHLRNSQLELEAVRAARTQTETGIEDWEQIIDETLNAISAANPNAEWEWEDEAFWSAEYADMLEKADQKNWNDRLWRNGDILFDLARRTDWFKGHLILDTGAGDGHYFRQLISQSCDPGATYIATDISIAALRLNRRLNPHKNAVYVVCSADNLPFRKAAMNTIFLFGILHHTRLQSKSLFGICDLLVDGGFILMHEGIQRPTLSEIVPVFSKRSEESAHEHRLDRSELKSVLGSVNLDILKYDEYATVFYGGAMRLIGSPIRTWRPLFTAVSKIDRALARTLGSALKLFASGEVLVLFQMKRRGAEPGAGA